MDCTLINFQSPQAGQGRSNLVPRCPRTERRSTFSPLKRGKAAPTHQPGLVVSCELSFSPLKRGKAAPTLLPSLSCSPMTLTFSPLKRGKAAPTLICFQLSSHDAQIFQSPQAGQGRSNPSAFRISLRSRDFQSPQAGQGRSNVAVECRNSCTQISLSVPSSGARPLQQA